MVLDTASISDRPIRRVKMKLHKAEVLPDGSPTELQDQSVFINGSVGGNSFQLLLDDGTEFKISGASAVNAAEGSDLLAQIQIANIFKQMDLSTVTNNEVIDSSNRHNGTNLCPQIDASANDLYTCFRKGLEKHAKFGEDKNGDDSLDDSSDDCVDEVENESESKSEDL
jgi:hypothetical protein